VNVVETFIISVELQIIEVVGMVFNSAGSGGCTEEQAGDDGAQCK